MNEKRFSLKEWEDLNYCEHCFYDGESQLSDDDVVVLLNEQQATNDYLEESNSRLQVQLGETLRLVDEQQATINELKAKLKEKEEDEKLYANEILELRETNKEWLQFKSLGGDY